MTKTGPGTLILAGANSYTGGSIISGGILRGSAASFGTGAIADNAAVIVDQMTSGAFAQPISGTGTLTKQGAGTLTLGGASSYSGGTTINAGVLQFGSGGVGTGAIQDDATLAYNSTGLFTLPMTISGTGGVSVNGGGTLTLGGANSYSGPTVVGSAGILIAGSPASLGSNSAVSLATGSTLTLNGNNIAIGSLAGTGGTITNNANSPATVTVGTDNTSQTFVGLIFDGTGFPLTFTKVGTGTQTLTGRISNTGGYTVNAGTLEFSGAFVVPGPSSLAAGAGATIQYDSNTQVNGGYLRGPGTHIVTGGAISDRRIDLQQYGH